MSLDRMKMNTAPVASVPTAKGPDPCDPLFNTITGLNRVRSVPLNVRQKCARSYFDFNEIKPFQFARAGLWRPCLIRDPARLMRHQGTYRLAEFYYPILRRPERGLKKLAETVLAMQGTKTLPVVLDRRPHRRYAGLFHRNQMAVHLADTLTLTKRRQNFGNMNANSLYHEIGHLLMYLCYQKRLPAYRGPTHDDDHHDLAAHTSPSSAWIEGFAGGMGQLDYGSESEIDPWDLRSEAGKKWLKLPLGDRLSNEFVIATILGEYIKSEVPHEKDGIEQISIVFDDASERRFVKIVATLQRTGMHQNFQEFVVDFLDKHPEESERLMAIMKRYGLKDILKAGLD